MDRQSSFCDELHNRIVAQARIKGLSWSAAVDMANQVESSVRRDCGGRNWWVHSTDIEKRNRDVAERGEKWDSICARFRICRSSYYLIVSTEE